MKAQLTKPEPVPDVVTLTLSLQEAQLLKKFAGNVGGEMSSQAKSRDYYTLFGDIFTTLQRVGVRSADREFTVVSRGGSLIVKDRD